MNMQSTCHLAPYARLEPLTAWAGGRLAETDLLTIDEAARMATRHAGTEVTPADFLRAAARGEILLNAICPRSVTMQPTSADRGPLHMPAGSLPRLPLLACKGLSVAGRARWRTCDAHERLDAFAGEWGYYTAWSLPDGEPDLEAVVTDCRVTGRDVHSLADACTQLAPLPVPAEPEPTDALVTPTAPELPDPQRRLAELRTLGGNVKWLSGKWQVTGMVALVQSEKGRPRSSQKTIRADLHKAAEAERREGKAAQQRAPWHLA